MCNINLNEKIDIVSNPLARSDEERYREALENIVKHMKYVCGDHYNLSAVWHMADKALNNNGGEKKLCQEHSEK